MACGVSEISAWAWVHTCHHHKRGRVFHAVFCSGNAYNAVFKRLSHHFEHRAIEFGQLVEKQHAIVCEAYFAGCRKCAATHQCHGREGVERRTERAHREQRGPAGQSSGQRGRTVSSVDPRLSFPATECIFVVSRASRSVRGGSMVGRRLASIVLPAPGLPISRMLWPPAQDTSNARFTFSCPRTSLMSKGYWHEALKNSSRVFTTVGCK